MLAVGTDSTQVSSDWQTGFEALLPEIHQRLQLAFGQRDAEACDEATADGVLICLLSYIKLHEKGRAEAVTASNLAWYAAKQIKIGRSAGCRLNSKEPLSRYAQQRHGIRVEQLDTREAYDREWVHELGEDRRSSILANVAARLDVTAWLDTLCQRTRRIAADLARGCTTAEVAARFGLSAARISQLRRELAKSWSEFQHEPVTE
jgi:hypothetical protein